MELLKPRKSRMLNKLRSGQKVISFKINSGSPRLVEMAASAGFDCVWICQEHVPTGAEIMEAQIMAGKAHDVDVLVRVAKGSYSDLVRPLEADASGIMVPHVRSAAEAKKIADTVRFQPVGMRPLDGGNADGMYCALPTAEYVRFVNENRFIVIQIEDPEAVAELDEICAVPGIDIIFYGPGDYAHALGVPGQLDNPEVVRVRKLVLEAAHRHGKYAATVASMANLKMLYDLGFDYLNCSSDVGLLNAGFKNIRAAANECGL